MRATAWLFVCSAFLGSSAQAQNQFFLPRDPDIHGDKVVYASEGDLWLTSSEGGVATRLTVHPGTESRPRFSPDGTKIAFTAAYAGAPEVYVMSVNGGQPERVTFDGANASVVDWMPDGKSLLYRSAKGTGLGHVRLWMQPLSDAPPTVLPMGKAAQGTVSADGNLIAYTKTPLETHNWARYQGGMANEVWLYNRSANTFNKLTNSPYNDHYPTFCGDQIYYVTDREGFVNLYKLDPKSKGIRKVTNHTEPVLAPGSDGKNIVYVSGEKLFTFDPKTEKSKPLDVNQAGDRIHSLVHRVSGELQMYSPGPTGKRVLIESRGQIFTAPTDNGDIRSLVAIPGQNNRNAVWSPDGKTVAFISDREDDPNVYTIAANGGPITKITGFSKVSLADLKWSPNGEYLTVLDGSNTHWLIDYAEKTAEKLTTDDYYSPVGVAFSPDSKLVAYVKADAFNQSSIYIYDIANQKHHRMTAPGTKDSSPAFDKSGKFLYFISERNVLLQWDPFDFQLNAGDSSKIMAIALTTDARSPFLPEIDEEPAGATAPPAVLPSVLNLAAAPSRIMTIPGLIGSFSSLTGLQGQVMFLQDGNLRSYSFQEKRVTTIKEGIASYEVASNGSTFLASDGETIFTGAIPGGITGQVRLNDWFVVVDPKKEWKQILREGWRHIRDTFYDPKLHGADWNVVWARMEKLLPSVGSREDLNQLIGLMQAEVNVSHMYNGGGYRRFRAPGIVTGVGSLGAEYAYEGNKLKITKILRGDGFELDERSPLVEPGVDVKVGDYIQEINGVVMNGIDPSRVLMDSNNKLVKLKVSSDAEGKFARTVWVKAGSSLSQAEYFDYTARNREYVEKKAGANIAYVHVPDMGNFGMAEFTKHFYPNLHKDGLILDLRSNGGGITSGMILERLKRVIFEYDQSRYGVAVPYHRMGFLSRVVLIVDEQTASDGEYFSMGYRYMKIGPSVGTRTWGGFVAVGGIQTIDGGTISCPVQGSYDPDGKWFPDGYGFKPDIEVEDDPLVDAKGGDAQLDKAIEVILNELKKKPVVRTPRQVPPIKK
jgi:tricorn protease